MNKMYAIMQFVLANYLKDNYKFGKMDTYILIMYACMYGANDNAINVLNAMLLYHK